MVMAAERASPGWGAGEPGRVAGTPSKAACRGAASERSATAFGRISTRRGNPGRCAAVYINGAEGEEQLAGIAGELHQRVGYRRSGGRNRTLRGGNGPVGHRGRGAAAAAGRSRRISPHGGDPGPSRWCSGGCGGQQKRLQAALAPGCAGRRDGPDCGGREALRHLHGARWGRATSPLHTGCASAAPQPLTDEENQRRQGTPPVARRLSRRRSACCATEADRQHRTGWCRSGCTGRGERAAGLPAWR